MKYSNSKTKMSWKKRISWFEPIGLIFLLVAFGLQCWQEHSTQRKTENYCYEIINTQYYIWKGVYDKALDSDQYGGKTMFYLNYDVVDKIIKPWEDVKKELESINKQATNSFRIRIVLYIIGSVLVIISKCPCVKDKT